jgi:hypothetical protein
MNQNVLPLRKIPSVMRMRTFHDRLLAALFCVVLFLREPTLLEALLQRCANRLSKEDLRR